ncbi:MAG: hypothetical protein HY318_07140 [Armatimonadetes bacterium]|nr:hypothetical protein [Armatimonadota bacterium]
MLDTDTKRRIDTARDILVGMVPDPKSQVEQITIAKMPESHSLPGRKRHARRFWPVGDSFEDRKSDSTRPFAAQCRIQVNAHCWADWRDRT